MNSFLERRQQRRGRGLTSSGGVMPSGGGLPVFEKRVQLKDPLPGVARGAQTVAQTNIAKAGYSPVGWDHAVRTDQPLGSYSTAGLAPKAPTPRVRTVRPHIPHHGPGYVPPLGSPEVSQISHSPQASATGARPSAPATPTPAATADAEVEKVMASGGLGSPSLAPMGGGASTRSGGAPTDMTARTSSPSGRFHPNPVRRAELRRADMFQHIDYYGGFGAPDNDRLTKEGSWLTTQSWFEGLRYYPKGEEADDDEAAYSGNTHGMAAPTEHLETDVRTRLGLAKADSDWSAQQLQMQWLPESPALLKRLKKSYLNLRR